MNARAEGVNMDMGTGAAKRAIQAKDLMTILSEMKIQEGKEWGDSLSSKHSEFKKTP